IQDVCSILNTSTTSTSNKSLRVSKYTTTLRSGGCTNINPYVPSDKAHNRLASGRLLILKLPPIVLITCCTLDGNKKLLANITMFLNRIYIIHSIVYCVRVF